MRDALTDRLRAGIDDRDWSRVHVSIIVGISGGAAFLSSVVLLAVHVHSMAWRYGVSTLIGYAAFLALLRAWVDRKEGRFVSDSGVDVADLPLPDGISLPGRSANVAANAFRGGRSGGAGASAVWGDATPSPASSVATGSKGGGGFSFDLDGDDLFWLLVALAAACAGAVAIGYVIYIAPTLMAEAAVNAAVAGKVYHGVRKREPDHWGSNLLRRTALPAAIVVASMAVAGYALGRVAPEAASIGAVWHHLRG